MTRLQYLRYVLNSDCLGTYEDVYTHKQQKTKYDDSQQTHDKQQS